MLVELVAQVRVEPEQLWDCEAGLRLSSALQRIWPHLEKLDDRACILVHFSVLLEGWTLAMGRLRLRVAEAAKLEAWPWWRVVPNGL